MTRLLPIMLSGALLFAACGGDEDPLAPVSVPEGEETTSSTDPVQATTSTEVVEEDEDAGGDGADLEADEAAVLQTWTTLLEAAASGAPDPAQLETIGELSSDNTTTQLTDFFPEAPARQLTHHAALTPQDDGTIAIDDCIIMNRGISTGFSNWFIGQADPNPDSPTGWEITNVQLINLDPCVPRSIADAAIQGYEEYLDAWEGFFNPPDPESTLLAETTTGLQLEGFQELAIQFRDDGQIFRGRPVSAPEFFTITSATELTIIDCQEIPADYGVFDASTDERTDLIPPVADGQLDLREADMVFENGRWKVTEQRGSVDVQCRTPPTPPTLQVTGG